MGRHHYREGDEPVPGYRLKRWLGEGGFGVAWMATAPGGTEVAMKMIDLSAKNALKEFRALRLVKRIRHPNLTPILAFWLKDNEGNLLDDSVADSQELLNQPAPSAIKDTMLVDSDAWRARPGELIMAMGLGDKTLSDRLEECQAAGLAGIPAEELLDYLEAAARAIDFLNSAQHNIQHCDIKPQNILIVGGAAQVCDFGLARAIQDNRATKVAVSYAYAAPESFQSKPSHATDQYSLAITYVELRTGELPFDDESAIGVMNAHLQGALNLKALPEEERQVIRRATMVDPDERYDSTLKMVRALRRAFESTHDAGGAPSHVEVAPPPSPTIRVSSSDEIVPGYRLVRQLVRGSTEEVWEATAPGGKQVALVIRELAESAAALDLDALSLVLRLGHPNLTEMLAFWLIDQDGLVLPDEQLATVDRSRLAKLVLAGKLSGSTLLQLLSERRHRTGKGIPAVELLPLIRQVAAALDFLNVRQHEVAGRKVGLLHCNVQPANLLLYGQTVRLGNFGRARMLPADAVEDSIAAAGFEMAYTPPEVFEGRLTRWTDQYGLALAYVHLRAGKPAFDAASSTTRLIQVHRTGELDFRELPEREVEVLRQATALDPGRRFLTCGEFIDALARAIQKRPSDTVPSPAGGAGVKEAAPHDKGKTEPIVSAATEVLDLKQSSTQDTTPNESSVIETQQLPDRVGPDRAPTHTAAPPPNVQVTSDWPGDEQAVVERTSATVPLEREPTARKGWRDEPKSGRSSRTKLVAGVAAVAVVIALGGAAAWIFRPQPEILYLKELDLLLGRAAQLQDADDELLQIYDRLEKLRGDLLAKDAFAARSDEVDLFEKRVDEIIIITQDPEIAEFRKLLAAEVPANATTSQLSEQIERIGAQRELLERRRGEPKIEAELNVILPEIQKNLVDLQRQALAALQKETDAGTAKALLDVLPGLRASYNESELELLQGRLYVARLQLASKNYAAARTSLADIEQAAPTDWPQEPQAELRLLGARLEMSDPAAAAEKIDTAIEDLKALLQDRRIKIEEADLSALSGELRALAERDVKRLDACLAVYEAADSAYPDNVALQLDRAALLALWLPQQITQVPKDDERVQGWFKACRDQCEIVLRGGEVPDEQLTKVKLLYAECLVEPAGGRFDPRAKERLSELKAIPTEYTPYAAYVRTLVTDAANGTAGGDMLAADLDGLAKFLEAGQPPLGLDSPHRRDRLGALYESEARKLRRAGGGSGLSTVQRIVDNPYDKETDAQTAARWLQLSDVVGSNSLDGATDFALAAYHGELDPHPAVARAAAEKVVAQIDKVGQDQLAIRWILARGQENDAQGLRVDLEQSSAIVDELEKSEPLPQLTAADAVLLHDRVVAQALARITSLDVLEDVEARRAAARLYAAQGELLTGDYPGADWKLESTERWNTAFRSLDRAVQLVPDSAEYMVGRARVRQYLPDQGGIEAALTDLDQAIKLDPEHAPAHYQKALILTRKAGTLSFNGRLQLFKDAQASSERAIEVIGGFDSTDPELANYLVTLCNAHINLANLYAFLSQPAECDNHLKVAEEIGERAVRVRGPLFVSLAYRALGNAQEDRAWLSGRREPALEKTYYDLAAESFEFAIQNAPENAEAYRDLGRLRYKQAVDSLPDPEQSQKLEPAVARDSRLRDAQTQLTKALQKNPDLNDARYWSAMSSTAQGDYLAAANMFAEYFADGDELGVGGSRAFTPGYAADYVNSSLQSLQALHDPIARGRLDPNSPEVQERLDAARACAQRLTELAEHEHPLGVDPANSALALREFANVLEDRTNAEPSLAALDRALSAMPASLDEFKVHPSRHAFTELLVARVHCRLRAPNTVAQASTTVDGLEQYLVAIDAEKLNALGARSLYAYRQVVPIARHVPPLATSAWAYYEVCGFDYATPALKRLAPVYSVFAMGRFRELIEAEPHHVAGWYWRWCAEQRFIAELRDKDPSDAENKRLRNAQSLAEANQPSTWEGLRNEALSYIEYATERAPESEKQRLRDLHRTILSLR